MYDHNAHRRRSIRLPGYDYAQPGAYFVTICVQGRECLFGEVVDEEMTLSSAGEMVASWWTELAHKFPSCEPDAFVIMPNHLHGIIVIRDSPAAARPGVRPHPPPPVGADLRVRPTPAPLPRIVQWFKTMTTNAYMRGVTERGWTPFVRRLWQRNYYEHIVHNDDELERVRNYIMSNPANWKDDPDNPEVRR